MPLKYKNGSYSDSFKTITLSAKRVVGNNIKIKNNEHYYEAFYNIFHLEISEA